MSKILKRAISILTSMSLCIGIYGALPVKADPPETPDTRKLTIDFLGRGSTPANEDKGKARLNTSDQTKEFWIGVSVNKLSDLPLFTEGVYSLELAFEYNKDYVIPYYTTTTTTEAAEADWKSHIISGNFTGTDAIWDSTDYEIVETVIDAPIDVEHDREDLTTATTERATSVKWKTCFVNITFKDTSDFATRARFKDIADDDTHYLLKLPFKLNYAPTDGSNPIVLSFVRGPFTFDIGSAAGGTVPYASWAASPEDTTDQTNLRNLFTFGGDIHLFDTTAASAVSNIQAFANEVQEDEEVLEVEKILSDEEDPLNTNGFAPETTEYWLSVPYETDKIHFKIESTEVIEVKKGGESVTVTRDGDTHTTADIDLTPLDPEATNHFINVIKITSEGGAEYTINIRRTLKPRVELEYGNSPAGLIMRDTSHGWTDEEKKDNIDEFAASVDGVNLHYIAGKVPDDGNDNIDYVVSAWNKYLDEDSNRINYDLNPYAIFMYQGSTFKDPVVTVYDELGKKVDSPTIDRTFKIKRQTFEGVSTYVNNDSLTSAENDALNSVTEGDATLVSGTTDEYTFAEQVIRTDVYFIDYTCSYSNTEGETITIGDLKRPVIILGRRGDIFLQQTPVVNDGDANYLKKNFSMVNAGNSLVAFRCANLIGDSTPVVNDGDANYLKKNFSTVNADTNQYYKNIFN